MSAPPMDRTLVLVYRPEDGPTPATLWVTLYDGLEVNAQRLLHMSGPYTAEAMEPFDFEMVEAVFLLFSARYPRLM